MKKAVNYRLPESLVDAMKQQAKAERRSMNGMIENVMQGYVDGKSVKKPE